MLRTSVLVAIVVASNAQSAHAQCADGSPPPCRTQTVASAPRRVDPPLDDKTWIVVPFDNLNNNQEVDWLRSGSVNLLYMSMSRWTDVRVIDDERVADYMREVPGAADAKQLSLATGLAVAKRAGAGRLVMGDLLKLGAKTTVNAKIFDVKTGQRIRTVRDESSIPDSLMPMFGKLSQKVLNIAPPAGSGVGVVGTNSIRAYQEYAQGMQALNKFELEGAQRHFNRALEFDSTFALAHSKLAVLLGWVSPGLPSIRQHAEAAGRLSGSLPPREKALIEASVAFARADYVKSCDGFRGLIRKDSTDTDAWYGLGDCLYHDPAVEAMPGEPVRVRWRSDRSASLRAFRTVLALDPTYHLAYQHLVDGYLQQPTTIRYCVTAENCANYASVMLPEADSIVTTLYQLPRDSAQFRGRMDDALRRTLHRVALEKALSVTETWLNANPTEKRAITMRAATLLGMGRIQEAYDHIVRTGPADSSNAGSNALLGRSEIMIKLWQADASLRLYDSLRAHPFVLRGGANPITIGNIMASVSPVFGQMSLFDSLVAVSMRGAPPARQAFSRAALRAYANVPSDTFATALNSLYREASAAGASAIATRQLGSMLSLGWRMMPVTQWPTLDTTVTDTRVAPALAMQRGDTAALRRAARVLDSISNLLTSASLPDSGLSLWSAEAFLAAGDSAAALRLARRFLDVAVPVTPLLVNQNGQSGQVQIPRGILLRADLAAALGQRDEARLWYGRLLAFWAHADRDAQAVVERVRKAYAAAGGT